MGQRSQIFIDIDYESFNTYQQVWVKHRYLIARYYQWNYGERMVSRARSIIDWLEMYREYLNNNIDKLNKIMEINFDLRDVVNTSDIIEEYKVYDYYETLNDIFSHQDNNDGQLYIKVSGYQNEDTDIQAEISYCFVDNEMNYLGGAEEYLVFDYDNWEETIEKYGGKEEIEYTKNNINRLADFRLMSEAEWKNFLVKDYSDYENIKEEKK